MLKQCLVAVWIILFLLLVPHLGDILKMDKFNEKTDFTKNWRNNIWISLLKVIYGCLMGSFNKY